MIGKRCAVAALAAGTALCMTGFAQTSQQRTLTSQDKSFLGQLSEANRAEVQLGQLAEQKATSPDVKEFGQRMAHDHSQLESELSSFASTNNLKLPTGVTSEQHQMVSQLSGLSGQQFDRQYMQDMVREHQKDVAEVKQHLASTQDPAVQDLLRKTLPVLQEHLHLAEIVEGQMGIATQPGAAQPGQ